MKYYTFLLAALLIAIQGLSHLSGQTEAVRLLGNCEPFPQYSDSVYIYDYDSETEVWRLVTIRHYERSNGRLDKLLLIRADGRVPNELWNYFYDSQGNRFYELSTIWRNNEWHNYRKRDSEFDSQNRKLYQLTSRWRNGEWTFNSYFKNEYENERLYKVVNKQMNNDGELYPVSYSLFQYDPDGKVKEGTAYNYTTGQISAASIYTYNENGAISELLMLRNPLVDDGNEELVNFRRRIYHYDEFNLLRTIMFEAWIDGEWKEFHKYEYFYKIDKVEKVLVCHNGRTICVSVNALKAFLDMGSTLGECPTPFVPPGQQKKSDDAAQENPFTIFPNPATDRITIRFNDGMRFNGATLQIASFNGRVVRSIQLSGQNEITIERQGLQKGNYLIKIFADEIYQTQVIFK